MKNSQIIGVAARSHRERAAALNDTTRPAY